jgi:putative chitinase
VINRKVFFDTVRALLFKSLSQPQVNGMNAILDEWEKRPLIDLRWLAYMLATTYHETARTMQPIAEYGGAHTRYAPYYGRGFVQVTWKANYEKLGKAVGVDLVSHPDRAMEMPIATVALFDGMIEGWFTTKKLADYFSGTTADWTNARRIINGTDKASTIAGYARDFEHALELAHVAPQASEPSAPPVTPPVPQSAPTPAPAAPMPVPVTAKDGFWANLIALLKSLFKVLFKS